uniref:PH domain-containing protein n=1 Tax=Parascaris equorum TaxID=6256 RepID=A0A914R638_PAREQ
MKLINSINGSNNAFKKQKREYRDEKKRVAQELLASLRDPTVVVMADWLKVRGTLRKWNRYYCVLKPGLMMIYKSNKIEKVSFYFYFLNISYVVVFW